MRGLYGNRPTAKKTVPATSKAPTLSKPGHYAVEFRINPDCGSIAVDAVIASRKDDREEDRGQDDSKNKQSSEDHSKKQGFRHDAPPRLRQLTLRVKVPLEKRANSLIHIVRRTPRTATHKTNVATSSVKLHLDTGIRSGRRLHIAKDVG